MTCALSLQECQLRIRNKTGNITRDEFVLIMDSMTIHIQSGEPLELETLAVVIDALKEVVVSCLFDKADTTFEKELEVQRKEMKDLKDKWEKLKKLEDDLFIGQMASSLEKEIVKYILQNTGVKCKIEYITIRDIDDALRGYVHSYSKEIFTSREQEDKAKENKAKLSADFPSINGDLYRAIHQHKHYRNIQAHPELNITNIRTRLAESQVEDKEMIDKFINLYETFQGRKNKKQ
uniref:Uncharacterized protein n=1 Tax=Amphimedon queenslandica TaxID=400682 RepID=A0A1X7UGB2_AMPQE